MNELKGGRYLTLVKSFTVYTLNSRFVKTGTPYEKSVFRSVFSLFIGAKFSFGIIERFVLYLISYPIIFRILSYIQV